MEKIASELEESELKQRSLSKAYESLHAQASSVLLFTVQWKDLEDQFESTRNSLESRFRELEDRDKEVGFKEKQLEAKEMDLNSQMESKFNELRGIEALIEERLQQVEEGKNHLHSLESLIEDYREEIDGKEKRFEEVQKLVRDMESDYDKVQERFKVRTRKLKWVEKTIEDKSKEVESKKMYVKRVQRLLNKYNGDIKVKERQLNEIEGSVEERKKEFDLKEEQIKAAQRSIEECDKEMKLKEEKVTLIEKSLVECSNTLDTKEKKINDMDLKVKDFCLHRQSMEEWSCKLELKERELEGWVEKLELKEKQIESKVEELNLIDKRVNECLNEVQEREKHLDSLKKSVEECSDGLEMKERHLEQQARELELKQKQFESIQKSTEEHTQNIKSKEKTNILDSHVKIEQLDHIPANIATLPSSTSNQSSANKDGKGLQLFMKEHLKRIDVVGIEMTAVLQASSDPAKLVLDAMQGFYPSNLTVDSREFDFDLRVIRRSCILLLEELKRVSPQINPQVREEAMKLAADWKAKMTVATDKRLEVLGFLRLLAAYELTSTYDMKELQTFLAIVSQHEHATELSRDLGITESSTICSPVEIEETEPSLAKNAATFSSPNLQITATPDARYFQGFLNEHLNGNHLTQDETLAALQMSLDPAKLVLNVMQTSFAQYWRKGDVRSNETIMLHYISLLDQLMRVLPHVGPQVKIDAIKLAIQWKARLGADTDNSLELLGFLLFIVTYGLLSTFNIDIDEVAMLLGRISQHNQALELCQTLGFADKIPDFIRNLIESNQLIEAVRLIYTFKLIDKFPPVSLLKEYVENAKKSAIKISKKKKSVDEKEKVIDDEMADLRAVIQCIKDYNLESEYPSGNIETQIAWLEKLKEDRRCSVPSPASKVELQEQKISLASKVEQKEQNKSLASMVEQQEQRKSLASMVEQEDQKKSLVSMVEQQKQKKGKKRKTTVQSQQRKNKCHQTSISAAAGPSYELPTFTPGYPPSCSSSWPYENYGYPGQFGMNANNHGNGANFGAIQNAGMHHPYQFFPCPPRYGNSEYPVPVHSADYGLQSSYPYS